MIRRTQQEVKEDCVKFMKLYIEYEDAKIAAYMLGIGLSTAMSCVHYQQEWLEKNYPDLYNKYKETALKMQSVKTSRARNRKFTFKRLMEKLGDVKKIKYNDLLNILAFEFENNDFTPCGAYVKEKLKEEYGVIVIG